MSRRATVVSMLLLLCMVMAVPAMASDPTVIVSGYDVSPPVLVPGETGTITITLANTAQSATKTDSVASSSFGGTRTVTTNTAVNSVVESILLKGEGIEVLSDSYTGVGEIGPGQSMEFTFLIRAPAAEGIYFPEVWIRIAGGGSVKYPVAVNVNTQVSLPRQPSIRVDKVIPESVEPGDPFTVGLTLENEGISGASDLSVTINSSTPSIALTSPGTFYLPGLEPGGQTALNVSFETDTGAPLGLQPVGVVVEFVTNDGSTRRQTETIGVPIQGRAEMSVAALETDPPQIRAGEAFDLIIRIENTGTDDARSIRATIDLPFPGSREAFVGTVEPDNDAPAVFLLNAGERGTYDYTLTIEYTDDWGVHTTEQELMMAIAAKEGQGLLLAAAVLVIAAAVVVVLVWRRRKGGE